MSRNQNQWRSIADFLTPKNPHLVLQAHERAGGTPLAGGSCADGAARARGASQTLPVGNHGEIVAKGVSL